MERRTRSAGKRRHGHPPLKTPACAPAGDHSRANMRKLRRLPWRIPKSHNNQSAAPVAEVAARTEPERRVSREIDNTQPVAFAGGRYVYGIATSVPCPTEIRRKARHRTVTPLGVTATRS